VLVLEASLKLTEPAEEADNPHANDKLQADYPQFLEGFLSCCVSSEEYFLLRKFEHYMYLVLQMFPPLHNKGKLMEVAGRLSGKLVITGGGETPETKRRVHIYEKLGSCEARKDPRGQAKKRSMDQMEAEEEEEAQAKEEVEAVQAKVQRTSPGKLSPSPTSAFSSFSAVVPLRPVPSPLRNLQLLSTHATREDWSSGRPIDTGDGSYGFCSINRSSGSTLLWKDG